MTKIILLILDGCRLDALDRANVPNIKKLMMEGIYTERCETVFPSSTGPAQCSILTGAYPEKTGLPGHFHLTKKNKLLDINSDRYCEVEMIFETLKNSGLKSRSIGPRVSWRGAEVTFKTKVIRLITSFISLNQNIMKNKALMPILKRFRSSKKFMEFSKGSYENFKNQLKDGNFDFFYMVLGDPDRMGHAYGPESDKYYEAIELCDKRIKEIVDNLKKLKEDWVLIISSDHGQTTISKRLEFKDLPFTKFNYKISYEKKHAMGKYIKILKYNEGKYNEANAVIMTRHMQIWLKNKNDIPKFVDYLKNLQGVDKVITKEESQDYHLNHPRCSDIIFTLSKDYGFDTDDWKGNHGGFNEEDILIPLIFVGNKIKCGKLSKANVIDIATTVCELFGISPPRSMQGASLLKKEGGFFVPNEKDK